MGAVLGDGGSSWSTELAGEELGPSEGTILTTATRTSTWRPVAKVNQARPGDAALGGWNPSTSSGCPCSWRAAGLEPGRSETVTSMRSDSRPAPSLAVNANRPARNSGRVRATSRRSGAGASGGTTTAPSAPSAPREIGIFGAAGLPDRQLGPDRIRADSSRDGAGEAWREEQHPVTSDGCSVPARCCHGGGRRRGRHRLGPGRAGPGRGAAPRGRRYAPGRRVAGWPGWGLGRRRGGARTRRHCGRRAGVGRSRWAFRGLGGARGAAGDDRARSPSPKGG